MYADFMNKLQAAFKAVNPVDAAMQKLALLRQGNRPVETMITKFRLLVGDAGLSVDSASDQIHLIKMFMNCLNPQLKKKIIFGDSVLRTIEGWYKKATQYDSNFRLAQAMMALDNQPTQKNTRRTWQNQNQNKDPNAMDIGATTNGTTIGALTEEMHATLMKIGACFRCRKTGHLSCDCPLKNQGQQQQQQQQKVFSAKEAHANLRNMMKEARAELMVLIVGDEDF